jgi:hypothetical protein
MRARLIGLAAISALLMAFMTYASNGGPAVAQDATPTAGASTPVATTGGGIVTLVGWYSRDSSGDFLNVGPIQINENMVAREGEPTDRTITGKIDFDDPGNDDLPRIRLGKSILDAVPVNPDDPSTTQRWTYYNDDPALRPSTLVMQVKAVGGPYVGARGTATLISRSDDGTGVIVVVLNPPAQ